VPLYEYRCAACGHEFEALVAIGATPDCPRCGSASLERLLSTFGVSSESTRSTALKSRTERLKQMERDRTVERREVIEKHDH
jgi:putative FmdB family regulatory protein